VKVLILGGGGREHAIAWKLKQDAQDIELLAVPGNPGIAALGRCIDGDPSDGAAMARLALSERVDLVVIGPEAPLAAGVSDVLTAANVAVFGPSQRAAELESSKRFAKEIMQMNGIPTAAATSHRVAESAMEAVRALGAPVVIKASGLAAGKGVIVASTIEEANHAIDAMFKGAFGSAGTEVLVEEFMTGEELSLFAVTDGHDFMVLPVAQDHKRLLDGDRGPNTGGMGAYCPVSLATPELIKQVNETIIAPTLAAMRAQGRPFRGLLYCGLMLTPSGPRVVEFNCRFGDPETQVVLPVMDDPLLPLLMWAAGHGARPGTGATSGDSRRFAVATVVAAHGYPESARRHDVIQLPSSSAALIFHAGTSRSTTGDLRSAGGRVLAVVGVGASFDAARTISRTAAEQVGLDGAQFRTDIGWREAERLARAP
jgi:phosphoribosylamine--glycine ligase